jgi:vitamin K-dependent gamma-carboxylase
MTRWWRRWVAVWDGDELPWSLALVRLLLGAAMLFDYLTLLPVDLVEVVMLPASQGGILQDGMKVPPPWWTWVGTSPASAWLLFAGLVASSLLVMVGCFTRTSAWVLLLLSAQLAWMHPAGDRGIDTMMRNVLMILAFSGAGQAVSIDAWWSTGSFWGDGRFIPRWPRRLLLLQLVAMYFAAGVSKYAQQWWPWGGYTALWFIWHDWPVSAVAGKAWTETVLALRFSQLATLVTILWEISFPAILWMWAAWRRGTPAWVRRLRPDLVYVALGATFHLGIALWLQLGIFPWAMLALYPAFLSGREWARIADAIRSRNLRGVVEALQIGP